MRWGQRVDWAQESGHWPPPDWSGAPWGVAFPWGAHPPRPFSVYIHLLSFATVCEGPNSLTLSSSPKFIQLLVKLVFYLTY